ncbi:MAG: hypothetical protein BWY50_00327 [Spirochaetes bacterium ADurb.Bin315]|jgi:hypothetical protein|nr:MAG: hypothetical protein BWY50_00327 [Spirochaetes bacterium ADurb.Bin315]
MIFLEYETLEPIDALLWHAYPKHESIMETYNVGELTVEVLDHPGLRSSIDLAVIAFSLLVFHKNEIIAVFQIEQEDLRSLAEKLGCSIRELQNEYRTKGMLSNPRVYIYTKEQRKDEGPYEEELTFFSAREFLLELMCDTFDLLSDPVLRG